MATTKKVFLVLSFQPEWPPLGARGGSSGCRAQPYLSGGVSAGKQSPTKASDLLPKKVEPKLSYSVGASFHTPKGRGFDSPSGHITRFWI